jgi:23S rRNA (uracil1939-C5)-methyltransferase
MSGIFIKAEVAVAGGLCLGHAEGRTIFLSGLIPGETAEVEVVAERAGHLFARPVRIIEPSPDRREPFCPYRLSDINHQCGGCDWQHIAYDRQQLLKREIFLDCLRRIGKISGNIEIELFESPDRNYRHRAQFKIDHAHRAIGFYCSESHDVVSIDACPVLTEPLNKFITAVHRQFSGIPEKTREIKAIGGDNDQIATSPVLPEISSPSTTVRAGRFSFEIGGDGFFQQNRFLLETMGTWAEAGFAGDHCIDLFGGCGFFSVFLSDRFARGTLIEQDFALVALARSNFALNGINHFSAEAMTAEQFFGAKTVLIGRGDCVVIDPPRTGLSPSVRSGLAAAHPRQILYISCDPATQARDLNFLLKNAGYRIKRAALFDLYPHTHHIETGILLDIR